MKKIRKMGFCSLFLGVILLSPSFCVAGISGKAGAFLDHFEEMFSTMNPRQQSSAVRKPIAFDFFQEKPNIFSMSAQDFRASFKEGRFSKETSFSKECPAGQEVAARSHLYTWNQSNTNALGLAIVLGRSHTLRRFLEVVDDPNSLDLSINVFRQQGSLAHVALDPFYPDCKVVVSLKTYLEMIDILGEKGMDFNSIPLCPYHTYRNPPLACQDSSGDYRSIDSLPKALDHYLRARAFLYGADPQRGGSSFHPLDLNHQPDLVLQTLEYYCERILANKGSHTRMVPVIEERLQEVARNKGLPLEKFEDFQRLRARIENTRYEMREISSPHSRTGKARLNHLNDVIQALEQESIRTARHLRRLLNNLQN